MDALKEGDGERVGRYLFFTSIKMAVLSILGRLYDLPCDVPQQINGKVQLMLPGFQCGQHRHFLVDSHLRWTEHHKAKSC